jgi:hypothetical protein
MNENQAPNNDIENNNPALKKYLTLNRLNALDIPGQGNVRKAIEHGRANMLHKLNPQNIKIEGSKNNFK